MKRIPAPARSLPGIPKPRNDGPIEAEAEPNPSDLGSENFWKRDVHGSNKATGSTVLCVFFYGENRGCSNNLKKIFLDLKMDIFLDFGLWKMMILLGVQGLGGSVGSTTIPPAEA